MGITRRIVAAGGALGAAAAIAACGSSGGSHASSASAANSSLKRGAAAGQSATQTAQAAGEKMGGEQTPVALPKETIGYLDQLGTAEVSQRAFAAAEAAAAKLGWTIKHCDAKGIPTQMTACGETLLNEHVNAIISTSMDPSLFTAQLKRAKSEHIPWVNTEDFVNNQQEFTDTVAPEDKLLSKLISEYVVQHVASQPGTQEVSIQTFSQIFGVKNREEEFLSAIKGHPIRVVNVHQTNLEALEEDTKRAVTVLLEQHPKLAAIFTDIDIQLPAVAQVFRERGLAGKSFPERPILVGFYGDKANLKAIREGLADAVVEESIESNAYAAFDQLAGYFGRKAVMKNTMLEGSYPLAFARPFLVTKENLPPEGQYVKPQYDYEAFFDAKWAKEFTTVK